MKHWFRTAGLAALIASSSVSYGSGVKFADVEIKLNDKLVKSAAGLRTLYLIVYDAESPMPMPFGALKVDLSQDATAQVFKGTLDESNLKVMGQGGTPKKLRIKARLDKDGSAGKDSPGDIVGQVEGIVLGGKAVVLIDKAI